MATLELTLANGRRISADSLFVTSTYAGLFEGCPDAEMNDSILASIPERVEGILGCEPIHLIQPERRTENIKLLTFTKVAEYLPRHWIAGNFTGLPIDDAKHASGLTLIWFQDLPFPIPSETVLPSIQALDWNALAQDFFY